MANEDDFNAIKDLLEAIPADDVGRPRVPAGTLTQEAENLCHWAADDEEKLVAAGLSKGTIARLQIAIGALLHAQGAWSSVRHARLSAMQQWKTERKSIVALFEKLVHDLLYALRDSNEQLERVQNLSRDKSNESLFQGRTHLALIGDNNSKALESCGIDLSILDEARAAADMGAELLAEASADSANEALFRDMRDRAYTHLKSEVNSIRRCGRYVFYRDPERKKGYVSGYLRTHRDKKATR